MRLYKKTYNLRQICNIAVYMVHSACTIHMLNLPEKTAKRDITHGVKQLEEIAEDWPCARRTLSIISVLARKWNVDMPEEAAMVLQRTDEKYGTFNTSDVPSPPKKPVIINTPSPHASAASPPQATADHYSPGDGYSQQTSPPQMTPNVMSPDFLNGFAMPSPIPSQNQTRRRPSHMPTNSAGSLSMNDALSAVPTAWAMPSVTTQSMGTFAPQYRTPMSSGMSSGMSGNGASRASTRQVSPSSSLYAIDGQDWYIKDGLNWQQNFEAWNNLNATTPAGNAGGGMQDNSMFMFRGLGNRGDFSDDAFDSLNMSMSNLDNLPNLD
jgi:hypothetical protein